MYTKSDMNPIKWYGDSGMGTSDVQGCTWMYTRTFLKGLIPTDPSLKIKKVLLLLHYNVCSTVMHVQQEWTVTLVKQSAAWHCSVNNGTCVTCICNEDQIPQPNGCRARSGAHVDCIHAHHFKTNPNRDSFLTEMVLLFLLVVVAATARVRGGLT